MTAALVEAESAAVKDCHRKFSISLKTFLGIFSLDPMAADLSWNLIG